MSILPEYPKSPQQLERSDRMVTGAEHIRMITDIQQTIVDLAEVETALIVALTMKS